MKNPLEVLRQKEAQLLALEAETGKLRHELEALRLAVKLMMEDGDQIESGRSLSNVEMTRRILSEVGHELRANEIRDLIKTKFGKEVKRSDLTSDIYRNFRAKERFFRKGSMEATFALLAWPENEAEQNTNVVEFPRNEKA